MTLSARAILPLAFLLAACTPPQDDTKKHAAQDAQIIQTAENLKHSGDAAGAVRVLRAAQADQPDSPAILSQLGYALIASGQQQEAANVFDHLMTLHPDNVSAYNGKGVALDRLGDHAAAQELYRQALKFSPDSLSVKNNLAMSMILDDKIDPAIALLEELSRQPGANPTVRQNLALAYGIKGDKAKALALNRQDLSDTEAQENMRFYEQYASEHKKPAVPASEKKHAAAGAPPPAVPKEPAVPATAAAVIPVMPETLPAPAAAPAASVPSAPEDMLSIDAAKAAMMNLLPAHVSLTPDPDTTYPAEDRRSNTIAPTALPTARSTQIKPQDKMQGLAPAAQNKPDDKTNDDDPIAKLIDSVNAFRLPQAPDADTTYPSAGKR